MFIIILIQLILIQLITSSKIPIHLRHKINNVNSVNTQKNDCNKIYYSDVQKIMIRNERPNNKILINNMLKKMSSRSGVSAGLIRNCAKQKKMN
jgi:hypothetical protein